MLNNKKPEELDDWTLVMAYEKCGQVIAQRDKARLHDKFKKMEFPPPNPAFIEMMNGGNDMLDQEIIIKPKLFVRPSSKRI